jgi:16S rRNA (guanine527-N7)-methyltransferase
MNFFAEALRLCAPELSGDQLAVLERHYEHLIKWNRVLNLTSIRTPKEVVDRHYCESLFLARTIEIRPGETVVDVGSGAGFPGVPFAVVHPECYVALVEGHARKSVFLREATRGLANIEVFNTRIELAKRRFDLLISRAVAWSDIATVAPTICDRVGLLAGEKDAEKILSDPNFNWAQPFPMPNGEKRVLLTGVKVSRGTKVE